MLNKQVLRVGKTLGYMRNKQVLRIEKPLGYMLNKQVLRVKKSTNHALKTQVYELNTAFLLTTFTPSTTQTAPKPLPLNRKHVSRQAHPLLRRVVVNRLLSPRFLSHPLLRRGLGRLFLSISFLLTFPSTPFCLLKDALLHRKRASFAV